MRNTITRLAIVATALVSIVLISFPSFPSTLRLVSKLQFVDRGKRDRLMDATTSAKNGPKSQTALVRMGKQVPVGCDRAFSSMSSPEFSTLFGRCLV
jgi:hypothetical protein